jgi:nitroreductase
VPRDTDRADATAPTTDRDARTGAESERVRPRAAWLTPEVEATREPEYDVSALFLNRWSPRAMTGEALPESTYMPLFEAARWAPSSYNNQHWEFLYADRGDELFDTYLGLLGERNRAWAGDAAVLVVVPSKTTFDHNGEHARTHSFDAGAAWENLALEGARRDLAVHAMEGFDYERAHTVLELPAEYEVEAMVAIGERAEPDTLPEPLQERERPSDRNPLDDVVSRGRFEPATDRD